MGYNTQPGQEPRFLEDTVRKAPEHWLYGFHADETGKIQDSSPMRRQEGCLLFCHYPA